MDILKIKENLPTEETINSMAELFKILADSTRNKILYTLEQSSLNVTDIAECLNMTKSAISHQLRILKTAKLVKSKKVGKEVFYSLDDEHVALIFDCALAHINE